MRTLFPNPRIVLFKCKICGKVFLSEQNIKNHILKEHLKKQIKNPSKRKEALVQENIEVFWMGLI